MRRGVQNKLQPFGISSKVGKRGVRSGLGKIGRVLAISCHDQRERHFADSSLGLPDVLISRTIEQQP